MIIEFRKRSSSAIVLKATATEPRVKKTKRWLSRMSSLFKPANSQHALNCNLQSTIYRKDLQPVNNLQLAHNLQSRMNLISHLYLRTGLLRIRFTIILLDCFFLSCQIYMPKLDWPVSSKSPFEKEKLFCCVFCFKSLTQGINFHILRN